ncbi:MAG: DUF5050 domain-containing protein [Candidatus Cloacimonadota bacterium]|nr:MAG: DUF5050 domain-containing protein [Candidatus Cloacimonadota bacterium]
MKQFHCILYCVLLGALLFPFSVVAQEVQLTSDGFNHYNPQWSPDSNWIAYHKLIANNTRQVFKVSSNGGAEKQLTNDLFNHYDPQWSPNGNWIAYHKLLTSSYMQIYKVSSSGGVEDQLTSDSYDHEFPQWSPNGAWIVYQKAAASNIYQIYKVPSSGGSEEALTSDSRHHERPQWSPNGAWIVYQKMDAAGRYQIYKVPSNGGIEIPLTSDNYNHEYPQWSPDGSEITYQKMDGTNYQIYKVSSAGICETMVSSSPDLYLKIRPSVCTANTVKIEYAVTRNEMISLRIFDITGSVVTDLVNGKARPGIYRITWNGTNLNGDRVTGGCYFVKLKTESISITEKIVVVD